jgi:hypothetical protein
VDLNDVGLTVGEAVRFVPRPNARKQRGTVRNMNPDGSVTLTDPKGSCRSIPLDRIERIVRGPRGGTYYKPLTTNETSEVST